VELGIICNVGVTTSYISDNSCKGYHSHVEMYKYLLIKELTTLDHYSQSVIELINIFNKAFELLK